MERADFRETLQVHSCDDNRDPRNRSVLFPKHSPTLPRTLGFNPEIFRPRIPILAGDQAGRGSAKSANGRTLERCATSKVEITNGTLTFVSPKEEEGSKTDLVFQGKLVGKTLSGTVNGPDGTTWQWTGERAPALVRTSAPKWGKPIPALQWKRPHRLDDEQAGSARMDRSRWNVDQPWKRPRTCQQRQISGLQAAHRIQLRQRRKQRSVSARPLRGAGRNRIRSRAAKPSHRRSLWLSRALAGTTARARYMANIRYHIDRTKSHHRSKWPDDYRQSGNSRHHGRGRR